MTWRNSKWLQGFVSLVVVAAIFGFLFPQLADYDEAWRTVADMSTAEVLALMLVALWNLVSYLPLMVAVMPGMRVREAAISTFASTAAANTLPGGGALGIGVTATIQRSYGFSAGEIALGTVVSGIWNNILKLGLPIVALACLAINGGAGSGLVIAAFVGVGVLAVFVATSAALLHTDRLAARCGRAAERVASRICRLFRRRVPSGWEDRAVAFRLRAIELVSGRAGRLAAATVVSHLSLFLVLFAALRAVGVSERDVGWAEVLAAFAFVRLLSAVPITPGGLGVVELGLTASLGSGLDDATQNKVAAAVLLYRALTWFVPIPIGIGAWAFWRTNRSWRRARPVAASSRAPG